MYGSTDFTAGSDSTSRKPGRLARALLVRAALPSFARLDGRGRPSLRGFWWVAAVRRGKPRLYTGRVTINEPV